MPPVAEGGLGGYTPRPSQLLENNAMDERYRILEELETIEEAALSIVDELATLKIAAQQLELLYAEHQTKEKSQLCTH